VGRVEMADKPGRIQPEKHEGSLLLDRRQFLKTVGGGIVILISCEEIAEAQFPGAQAPQDFNAFLRVGEDGRVACLTGKIEMGQGIVTSLAQMLAEELDVPLSSVDMVMGDTDLCPWDMGTFGSRSTRYFGPLLREAAAEARTVLIRLAAERLKLPEARLIAREGSVIDRENEKNRISYAALAKGKKIERRLEKKPDLKPVSTFTVSGKPVNRRDALDKVTGKAQFTGDVRLPGMLYAKILRPPGHGARLRSLDTTGVEAVKGVRVIRDDDLVAVLHSNPDEAEKALAGMKSEFDLPGPAVNDRNIFEHLLKVAPDGTAVQQLGDIERGRGLAKQKVEGAYLTRYVAHAPMETHTATVNVERNRVTVYASTQRPFAAKEEVSQALGVPSGNVRVITPFVGGGFGGKSWNRQVVEAARLSKLVGKPVQVMWSREEEFFYDTFQPAAIVKIKSGLDDANRIVFWDYHVYFAGERSSQCFYDVPHILTVPHASWSGVPGAHPFQTATWRAPASNTNTFARESHIDVMAAKAGIDPLVFRINHLRDGRMRRVLETAARQFGWGAAKRGSGRGHGVACNDYLGTYVAAMAEIDVNKETGRVQVNRVVCSQDMGQVINPEGARQQMEGCVMMGLGYTLSEEIRFDGGRIHDRNFDTYEIPRFSWLPKTEAILVENQEMPPLGGGEPAITCMGAVVANALFDAVGVRLFELPLTPERIKKALSKG
jgi:isoquinoline 1-oxidoreductase